jgi:DNA-binding transcriptional regulator YiaG
VSVTIQVPPEGARRLVTIALRNGWVERQPCEICGDIPTDAHHDDYAEPLTVRWLCEAHHQDQHRFKTRVRSPLGDAFSDRVRQARVACGMNQSELARELGVSYRAVQTWEGGINIPRSQHLRALAAVTGKPVSWFFEEVAA